MRRGIVLAGVLGIAMAAAAAVKGIDTSKSGEYVSGPWKYVYTIRAAGSRSEGRHGVLLYNGRPVEGIAKAGLHDRIRTPWGLMQFRGPKQRPFGGSGWLTKLTYDRPLDLKRGKLLPPPKAKPLPPPGPLELKLADSGKVHRVALGQRIHVRLAGNITTGYSWSVERIEGDAVRQEGKVAYKPTATGRPRVGGGGTFEATFKAVKLGRGHLRMGYRRPWEKGKAPIKVFEGIFDVVQPWQIGEDAQGVRGVVVKLTGNHMPRVGPARPGGGASRPLSVPVHVFKGALKPLARPNPKHPALVKTVRSDKQGNYRASLPPGVYTVVAEIKGKLYLNVLRSDGNWATVTVHPGRWTTWAIRDTSEAAF